MDSTQCTHGACVGLLYSRSFHNFKQEMEKPDMRNEVIHLLEQGITRLVPDLQRRMISANGIGLNFWDQLTLTHLCQHHDRPAVLVAPTSAGLKMFPEAGHSEVSTQASKLENWFCE